MITDKIKDKMLKWKLFFLKCKLWNFDILKTNWFCFDISIQHARSRGCFLNLPSTLKSLLKPDKKSRTFFMEKNCNSSTLESSSTCAKSKMKLCACIQGRMSINKKMKNIISNFLVFCMFLSKEFIYFLLILMFLLIFQICFSSVPADTRFAVEDDVCPDGTIVK